MSNIADWPYNSKFASQFLFRNATYLPDGQYFKIWHEFSKTWIYVVTYNNHYKVIKAEISWPEAQAYCLLDLTHNTIFGLTTAELENLMLEVI